MKLSDEDKNTLKLARAFEATRRTEGWHYLKQILESRKQSHTNSIMSGTTDLAGVLAGERDKGAVVGLTFAIQCMEVTCSEAEAIRKQRGEDPDATD